MGVRVRTSKRSRKGLKKKKSGRPQKSFGGVYRNISKKGGRKKKWKGGSGKRETPVGTIAPAKARTLGGDICRGGGETHV